MPRPAESASVNKTRRRRQRRFGGGRKKQKLHPSEYNGHGGRGPGGFLTTGVSISLGAISWLWYSTIGALSWSNPRVEYGGRTGQKGTWGGWADSETGISSSREEMAAFALVLGFAAAAGVFVSRRRKGYARQVQKQQPAEGGEGWERVDKEVALDGDARIEEHHFDKADSRNEEESNGLGWPSSQQRRIKRITAVEGASGERRLSLYDVLTGEAPMPPPPRRESPESSSSGSASVTAAAAAAADTMSGMGVGRGVHSVGSGGSGGGRSGNGVVPLGRGARRASIFDRIADVVFNEEQKEQNPVDTVAVRSKLEEEFRVSFREGAMGMTLSMDPDSRNAVVGNIVEQGQAFRAGVQTDDLVVGVGEQVVSSYGTVLAFMNIMGRPIELHFRKADTPTLAGNGDDVGPGGGPVSTGDGGGRAAVPEGGSYGRLSKSGSLLARGSSSDRAGGDSLSRKFKGLGGGGAKSGGGGAPISPISPRSSSKVSKLGRLDREVASSDSDFSQKMEHGVVVTKYDKKGAASQRVLFLEVSSMSVAWRDLDARSSPPSGRGGSPSGHHRSVSFTSLLKGKKEALPLAQLIEVVGGDDPDPTRPSEKGSPKLREHCDESLLDRSFSLQFKKQSLEMTCDSHAEMRQLVTGFRDLQSKYGK